MGAHFRMKHWISSVMWVCLALQKVVPFIKRVHIPQCNVMNRRHGTCVCQDATESQCAQSADPTKTACCWSQVWSKSCFWVAGLGCYHVDVDAFKTNLAWKNPLPIANLKKRQGKRWWKRLAREPWLTSDKQNCFVAVVAVGVVVVLINWFVALFPQECLSPSVQLCLKVLESGGDGFLDKLVGNLDQRPC